MTTTGAVRSVAAIALLLGLTACADRGGDSPAESATPSFEPAASEGLVLQVEYTGGFVPPAMTAGRLPIVSVYADGRVISEGPVAAVHPAPALPNLQVQEIEAAQVQEIVDRALAAGVAETDDLGTPPLADAFSTRFTLVTATGTHVREAYALSESGGMPDNGLTPEQTAAREKLSDLFASLTDLQAGESASYAPDDVAAIVSPWVDPGDGLAQPERTWPGPALPGQPTGGFPDVSCLTTTGAEAQALRDAAGQANAATPWVTGDGARWSVTFRPLLPDETGCADLTD
jgi:hypothetical protein